MVLDKSCLQAKLISSSHGSLKKLEVMQELCHQIARSGKQYARFQKDAHSFFLEEFVLLSRSGVFSC